jgi:hypothetical protein
MVIFNVLFEEDKNFVVLDASLLHGLKEDDFLKNNLSNMQKIVVVTMHI